MGRVLFITVVLVIALGGCGGDDEAGSAPPRDGGRDQSQSADSRGMDRASDRTSVDGAPAQTCEQAGCQAHQLCELGSSGSAGCKTDCEPGFTWDASAQICKSVPGATCGTGPSSIAAQCDALNRICNEAGGVAQCGACFAGLIQDGTSCRPPASCDDCAARNRDCDQSGAVTHCGACSSGFVEALGGTCVRRPDGCTGSSCPSLCPAGQGWDPSGGLCFACLDGLPSMCGGAGETGNVVIIENHDGARCICETRDGFYPGSAGNAAQPCDNDHDGWIRESAQPAYENDNAVIRQNARCHVLAVDRLILQGESGATKEVPLAQVLPLYESDRNDGAASSVRDLLPPYGDTPLSAQTLNSFTKACASTTADHNHNGLEDVSEWGTESAQSGPLRAAVTMNAKLLGYYQQYSRFSYFIELNNGGYEPVAGSSRGVYRIAERSRKLGGEAAGQVPLVLSGDQSDGYWRSCKRHVDSLYRGAVGSYAGGDFALLQASGTTEVMLHSSQFKCVGLKSEADYNLGAFDATAPPTPHPEIVFIRSGSEVDRKKGGALETLPWTPNACKLTAEKSATGAVAPSLPEFSCGVVELADAIPDHAYWMIVGYENRFNTGTPGQPSADYIRGCINECIELGTSICPSYVPVSDGSGRFTCYGDAAGQFGKIVCGCGVSYGGAHCEIGCPASDLFRSDPYVNVAQRGYWLCGRPMASDGTLLSGGGYVLRGAVPIAPMDGSELNGGGYTLRAE